MSGFVRSASRRIRSVGRDLRRAVGAPVQADMRAREEAAEQRAQEQIQAQEQRAQEQIQAQAQEEEQADTRRRRQLRGGLVETPSLFGRLGTAQRGGRSTLG